MARSSFNHWLVGLSSSVLKDEFVSSYRHGDSLDGVEPFSGKLMLPTKLQTLKLHFFLRCERMKGLQCSLGNMRGSGGNRVAPSQPLPGAQRLFVA